MKGMDESLDVLDGPLASERGAPQPQAQGASVLLRRLQVLPRHLLLQDVGRELG